ncbi:condensin complex subunit 2-like [Chelonus insularis]|uniref:condensin complex subunit 2-like n=1 Tax=Chelonus insularis TaxID=460826 RepID=UPI001588F978|nr:condensin complex subunit 2-like [Chelonus insularis]
MDRRKSLGHMLLENSTSPTTGVLQRRSALVTRQSEIDLNVNDDEAERASLRLLSEQSPTNQTSITRRSLNLGTIVNMTSPQIVDGIAQCIKLNAENKINIKNAFSLNMIDFMSWMAKNKQQEMGNLQMAAVGLDVSAKIYALRVTDLYNKTLNMAGNLVPENNDEPENENTEEINADVEGSQNLRQSQQRKKKRNANKELFTTIKALEGKKDSISLDPIMYGENDCQLPSMLYQYLFPQHCTPSLFLHFYNDIIIDENVVGNDTNSNIHISWPPILPSSEREINSLCTNFEFINYSIDSENSSPNSSQSQPQSLPQDNNLVFDFDASLPPNNEFEDVADSYEMDNDDYEHRVGCHSQPAGPVMLATLENIIDKLPTRRLEYSVFDHSLNIRWVGPSHWKIKSLVKNQGSSQATEVCTQNPKRKRKEFKLEYSTEKIKIDKKKFKKCNSQLKISTLKYSWDEEKLFFHYEPCYDKLTDSLYKLFMRPEIMITLAKNTDIDTNTVELNNEAGGYNDYNLNDTYNDCPDNQIDDIPLNENSNHENYESDDVPQDFVGENLIEAPKLTQKIFIPFSQRAKKLDMHKLKKCIWKELTTVEHNHNENNTHSNVNTVHGEKSFVQVFANLPKKLNKNDAEDLSFPIAFVSLLHLANEKCLKISGNDNYSDLKIQQDES